MSWTDERIAQLKKLWEKGLTASQIAEALGNGLSRNAVIGKAHRLGLKSRPSPVKSADAATSDAQAAKTAKSAVAEAAAPPPAQAAAPAAAPAEKAAAKPRAAKAAAPAPAAEKAVPAPKPAATSASVAAAAPAPAAPVAAEAAPEPAVPDPTVMLPRPVPVAKPAPSRSGKGGKTTLLDLTDKICKWPFNHPDEPDFHFCGQPVNPGFPYCTEHCAVAYQAQLPRRDRPRPPIAFPGMRSR